jgi:hypothetical protein
MGDASWSTLTEAAEGGRRVRARVLRNGEVIRYEQLLEGFERDTEFRRFFCSALAGAPYSAFLWETPPVTESTKGQPFEYMLIDSPSLARLTPDTETFAEHLEQAQAAADDSMAAIATFPSLRKDAFLVAPCQVAQPAAYTHFAAFVRNAPQTQQHALLQTVAAVVRARLSQKPLWLSTSGLGVSWLHIRLDSRPKYYQHQPYRSV